MKKNFLFSMAAIAGMLFASGCSQDMDSLYTGNGEETEVSFMLNAPAELGSRGAANGKQLKPGDGMTVGRVVCAVFDASGNEISHLRDTVTMTAKQAVFSTRLVKGQAYKIVCFAYSNAQAFDFADMTNIGISYPQSCNDETLDAFAGQADIATAEWASGSVQKTITLKRPFAQLNIASSEADWTAATAQGYTTGLQSEVTVTNVYTAFNAYANEVTGSLAPSVTFDMASAVNDVVTVNGVDYHYVALGYFLAGDANSQQSLTDVTLTWQSAGTPVVHTYANVPVQRNYRTNILGAIFTNPVDVNIIVDETFVDEYTLDIWDGQTVTAVTPNAAGEYEISNGAQLAWIAQEVNKTPNPNSFQGKTVKLMKDIDLGNARWTPIGNLLSTPSTSFKGTFDGNSKTIRNMNAVDYTTNHATAGLFGSMVSATVKDLTIKDFSVSSTHYAAAICAYNEGDNSTVIENCVVENGQIVSSPEMLNGEWDNGDKVGGIIGYTVNGNKVLGCTVKDVEIKGYRDMGGIVGCAGANCEVSGNTLENVTITVDAIHNYKNYTTLAAHNVNNFVGRQTGAVTIENNNGDATIVYQISSESATTENVAAIVSNAISAGETQVNLVLPETAEPVKLPSNLTNVTLTVEGTGENTVIDIVNATPSNADLVALKNLTVQCGQTNYKGFQHTDEVYMENCTIKGLNFIYAPQATFKNCVFDQSEQRQYCLWLYVAGTYLFEDCTFNTKGKALLVYNETNTWNNYDITLKNCAFHSSDPTDKAALEIHSELVTSYSNCRLVLDNVTADSNFASAWVEKNNGTGVATQYFTVVKDGVTIQTAAN